MSTTIDGQSLQNDTTNAEEVFSEAITPLDIATKPKTVADEGVQPVWKGLETALTSIEVPPAEVYHVPNVYKYPHISPPVQLPVGKGVVLQVVNPYTNQRIRLLSNMWKYHRYSVDVKFDTKQPLGRVGRYKIVVIPEIVTKISFEEVLMYPGYDWDIALTPTQTVTVDWPRPEFLLPVTELVATVAMICLGEGKNTTTPDPAWVSPTIITRDHMFAVHSHVRIDQIDPPNPQPNEVNPINAIAVVAEQILDSEETRRTGRTVWKWIYRLVGKVGAPFLNVMWPGTGDWVETGLNFVWNVFGLEKRNGRAQLMDLMEISVSKGTPVKVVEEGEFMGVVFKDDGPTYVLASGDPSDPEPVKWTPPAEGQMQTLLAAPKPVLGGTQLFSTLTCEAFMTAPTMTVPIPADGKYKIIKPSLHWLDSCKYILRTADGNVDMPLANVPKTAAGDPAMALKIRIEKGPLAGRDFAPTYGYFPRGWKLGEPPETIFSPITWDQDDWDHGTRYHILMHRTNNRTYRGMPVLVPGNVDVDMLPESDGAPYAFFSPIHFPLTVPNPQPIFLNGTDAGNWTNITLPNCVYTDCEQARKSMEGDLDTKSVFVGLTEYVQSGSKDTSTSEFQFAQSEVDPPQFSKAPEKLAGIRSGALTAPVTAVREGPMEDYVSILNDWHQTGYISNLIFINGTAAEWKCTFNGETQSSYFHGWNKKMSKREAARILVEKLRYEEASLPQPTLRSVLTKFAKSLLTEDEPVPALREGPTVFGNMGFDHYITRLEEYVQKGVISDLDYTETEEYGVWSCIHKEHVVTAHEVGTDLERRRWMSAWSLFRLIKKFEEGVPATREGPIEGTSGNVAPNTSHMATPTGYRTEQPLGHVTTHNTADDIWSPIEINMTMAPTEKFLVPLTPMTMNTAANPSPSHLQVEAFRHMYCGPNNNKEFMEIRICSVANAFVNGRLIIAHVPHGFTQEEANALDKNQLMQYPRTEHEIKGSDTLFTPMWTVPLPVIPLRSGSSVHADNGQLVMFWAEYAASADATPPALSLWVRPHGIQYSIVVPHYPYKPRTNSIRFTGFRR